MAASFPEDKVVDARTRDNWRKIKKGLEEQGMTNCDFYRRAVMICSGMTDPGPSFNGPFNTSSVDGDYQA